MITSQCHRICVLILSLGLLCSSAQAVYLNDTGTGQVLLLPFYSVEEGFQSLITIQNTRGEAKAIRVRFREAWNQREVLQFNLYLGPYDSWTGALFSLEADGPANLLTRDRSCMVPDIIGQTTLGPNLPQTPAGDRYVAFRSFGYTIDDPESNYAPDEGPDDLSRTRQGMIEIIELGTLTDDTSGSAAAATLLVSGSDVTPPNCEQLSQAWLTDELDLPVGYWAIDPDTDIAPPGGGLTAQLSLIDVLEAVQISYEATALGGFSEQHLHTEPTSPSPDLASVNSDVDADGFVDSVSMDPISGEEVLSNWDQPIDAVTALLMSPVIDLDFNLFQPSEEWATSFMVNFPTKRYYTDEALIGDTPRAPFTSLFSREDSAADGACEEVHVRITDRNATVRDTIVDGLPPLPNTVAICAAVNPLRFDDASADLFGDAVPINAPLTLSGINQGLLTLSLADDDTTQDLRQLVDRSGSVYSGVPVLAFSIQKLTNRVSFGQGVLGNYAGLFAAQRRNVIIDRQLTCCAED